MPEPKTYTDKTTVDPLDPLARPPIDRFCDVVLEGGVVNGVVYPGFLLEIARKFRFHAIAGASVGAIAAALAAACEYNRRFGKDNGFNEGLAKMPNDLAAWVDKAGGITKIQSLFQPEKNVKQLFDFFVDVIGSRNNPLNEERKRNYQGAENVAAQATATPAAAMSKSSSWPGYWTLYKKLLNHFGPFLSDKDDARIVSIAVVMYLFLLTTLLLFLQLNTLKILALWSFFGTGIFLIWPLAALMRQITCLIRSPGFGMCRGTRADGNQNASLVEWLHEGIQKSAQISLHCPLTFGDLWNAPCGPQDEKGNNHNKSIDLRMITTCLSQGRIYELPQKQDDTPIMFRLSELKDFFPPEIIDHLRKHSQPIDVKTHPTIRRLFDDRKAMEIDPNTGMSQILRGVSIENRLSTCEAELDRIFKEPELGAYASSSFDVRQLPVSELPIVVAARMSMSCPVLFQALPFLGFNFDEHPEDLKVVRLWFSDGGIGSNFPIHIFDEPIPRWPTLGLKLLDESPRNNSKDKSPLSSIPYWHDAGSQDNLIFPRDDSIFSRTTSQPSLSAFIKFVFSIYTSAKDGSDQSFLRMPDVRNRVVRIYMNNRSGNALNLQISPESIVWLACTVGVEGGRNAANAYLADLGNEKYRAKVNLWQDHRWVRTHMLINGLRQYLRGIGDAVNKSALPGAIGASTLRDQIALATGQPQLSSVAETEKNLTSEQAAQINSALDAIIALEKELSALDLPQAYVPKPQPVLRFKPQY